MSLAQRLANRSRDLQFFAVMNRHWRAKLLGTVRCLLYHRVDQPGASPFLDQFGAPAIAPAALEEELRFLQSQGARFMTLADLRQGEFPTAAEFGVIVSFDDGFRDNYTAGLDVLDSLGIRCTLFQSTALVGAESLIWEHALYWHWHDQNRARVFAELAHERLPGSRPFSGRDLMVFLREQVPAVELQNLLAEACERQSARPELARLAQQLYPTEQDLMRAHTNGHELGSHGHHHYKRTAIDAAMFEDELRLSIDILHRVLGTRPKAFSFPFDSYGADDFDLCGRYFQQVATVGAAPIRMSHDPLALPRFTWPGPQPNELRRRRWLLTGRV